MIFFFLDIRFHGKTINVNSAHSNDNDESLRELIFRSYLRYEPEQEHLLDQLLRKRFFSISNTMFLRTIFFDG